MDISQIIKPRIQIERGHPINPRGEQERNFKLFRQSIMQVYSKRLERKKGRGAREGCRVLLDTLLLIVLCLFGHMGILYILVFRKWHQCYVYQYFRQQVIHVGYLCYAEIIYIRCNFLLFEINKITLVFQEKKTQSFIK